MILTVHEVDGDVELRDGLRDRFRAERTGLSDVAAEEARSPGMGCRLLTAAA